MDLKSKSVIVTGGGKGIGKGIALAFARHGADIMVCDLNMETAENTAKEIEALGRKALSFKMDVTNEEDTKRMAKAAVEYFGKIDVLCNNAGIVKMSLIEETELKDWELQFAINCRGVFLCSKAVIPFMKKQGSGRIINTASQAGKTGLPLVTTYCATKAAVILFTKGLAMELAPYNILVNSVCPGSVNTDMTAQEAIWAAEKLGGTPASHIQKWKDAIPLNRLAEAEDIARVVVFLASDYSSYMTGQAINVTGGQTMH
ncbi:SDR family NAD(P)-dependent oxidoreductase [Neobacillus sp. NPDC097160]|uniref:SDR family NAD(P)-dependent oxidoreductase n=1 Tax=Neobacillus sp. NPDC097160 TaxID=3364298 RepID=UPI00381DACC0